MSERCETCRFWRENEKGATHSAGECHRFPRQVVYIDRLVGLNYHLPRMVNHDWCGEYQSKGPFSATPTEGKDNVQ